VAKSGAVRPAASRKAVVTFAAKDKADVEPRTIELKDYRNIGIMVLSPPSLPTPSRSSS
jgi:hypothetical protein